MSTHSQDVIRVFCALTLDDAATSAVSESISGPRSTLDSFRWVRTENWHITLKFFGDVHPSAIDDLSQAMTESIGPVVTVQLTDMGAFPNLQRPRVLWVGVDDPHEQLGALHSRFEDACARLSFERERREYRPHLTVARPKRGGSAPVVRTMEPLWNLPVHETQLKKLVLFSSEMSHEGRVYRPLREVNLQDVS